MDFRVRRAACDQQSAPISRASQVQPSPKHLPHFGSSQEPFWTTTEPPDVATVGILTAWPSSLSPQRCFANCRLRNSTASACRLMGSPGVLFLQMRQLGPHRGQQLVVSTRQLLSYNGQTSFRGLYFAHQIRFYAAWQTTGS